MQSSTPPDGTSLFTPLKLRGATFRNRIVVSPMCQYSSEDGFASDWHLAHLGSRAIGGAGLVFTEATAVSPEGRISPQDLGLWKDEQIGPLARVTAFVSAHGAIPGIQLAHAGRKASCRRPWEGGKPIVGEGGWPTLAPSALPFRPGDPVPRAMSEAEIEGCLADFVAAVRRALAAGFRVIELHAAHGYLLHEFLSPLSNQRTDRFGGSFENRLRFVTDLVAAVRQVLPADFPLFVRASMTDWAAGGWGADDSVRLARALAAGGVDLVDCSSGFLEPGARVPNDPGFNVPFARRVRAEAKVATGVVGLITEAHQADVLIREGSADLVFLARELLRDPYWPLHAAKQLGVKPPVPPQYERGFV